MSKVLWGDGSGLGVRKGASWVPEKMAFEPNPDRRMELSRMTEHEGGVQGEGMAYAKPQSTAGWAVQKTTSSHAWVEQGEWESGKIPEGCRKNLEVIICSMGNYKGL